MMYSFKSPTWFDICCLSFVVFIVGTWDPKLEKTNTTRTQRTTLVELVRCAIIQKTALKRQTIKVAGVPALSIICLKFNRGSCLFFRA